MEVCAKNRTKQPESGINDGRLCEKSYKATKDQEVNVTKASSMIIRITVGNYMETLWIVILSPGGTNSFFVYRSSQAIMFMGYPSKTAAKPFPFPISIGYLFGVFGSTYMVLPITVVVHYERSVNGMLRDRGSCDAGRRSVDKARISGAKEVRRGTVRRSAFRFRY